MRVLIERNKWSPSNLRFTSVAVRVWLSFVNFNYFLMTRERPYAATVPTQ